MSGSGTQRKSRLTADSRLPCAYERKHNFQQVPGSALSSIHLVEIFRLNDPGGPYSGISSDIAFKQTLEKIRVENEAILRRVAKEMPDLLDPASRL